VAELKEGLCETFFSTFIGEKVEIVASFYQDYMEETEERRVSNHSPASIQGYILDLDPVFLYLGKNPHEVSMCLRRDSVLYIEILVEKSAYDEMLENFEVPDNKTEQN
jgi:hypothetical protein